MNTFVNCLKVFLLGALFLISSTLFAERNPCNRFVDNKAKELAGKYTDIPAVSRTFAFARQENWDSVLVNSQKVMQLVKDRELLDFVHYYRGEAFYKKGVFNYSMKEFGLVGINFSFYTMVKFYNASILLNQEKYTESLSIFNSIDTTDQEVIQTIPIDALFHNIGGCYLHLGDYKHAEEYLLRVIQLIQKKNDKQALAASYMDLAAVYYEQYLDEKAIAYFEKAYRLAREHGTIELKLNTALNMAVIEENRKRYDQALAYRKEFEGWRDSLNDQNKIYEVAQIEKKLALAHEQQRVKLLQTENKLKQARLNMYLFVAVLLLVIIGLGTYFYRQKVLRSRVILRQKQELDVLNATKDQLFSIVSHDLRSSVHALSVSNSNLKDKVQKQEYDRLESQLEENSVIATNTYNMLDNLLNWALLQTEGGYFMQDEHRLSQLIDQVAYNFKGVLNQKGITFENLVPKSVKVFVDAESLKIVWRNFMDNSIKFSGPGSVIRVSMYEESGCGADEVCVVWSDTGKGMSEETRLKLLSDSPQLTRKDHEKTIGSGLGMNLCRAMLAKNAGKLDIWSKPNEGTRMLVTLKKCADGKDKSSDC